MNVNPLDLQVLFSKAGDYAASLGKQSSVHDAEDFVANEQQTRQSKEAPEEVNRADAYAEEFTNINEHTKGQGQQQHSGQQQPHPAKPELKPGLTEEGTGLLIDITD